MKPFDFIRKNRSFLLLIFLMLAGRWSLADQYRVPTGSMEPTLQVGDQIGVNKMAYDLKIPFTKISLTKMSDPQRGDIVVFESPVDGMTLVKRLIGIPGDQVWVQGEWIVVPKDSYYFLGDNRENSLDSRVWGFAPRSAIKGKVATVLYNVRFEHMIPQFDPERTLKTLN